MRHLTCLILITLLAACGGRPADEPVTARNLSTGVLQSFGSEADVPQGWAVCSDPSCSVPSGIPCQDLGPTVCVLSPDCRLMTLGCPDVPDPTFGGSMCEPTCIPKLPPLCNELTDPQACAAQADCEWESTPVCPMCVAGPGCPECKPYCHAKIEKTCDALSEAECAARPDCAWENEPACPMCAGPGCPECKPYCYPAQLPDCDPAVDCGPPPPIPSIMCPDGKTPMTQECLRQASGQCAWQLGSCPPVPGNCIRTGCSGQLCASQEMPSTCEAADYYQCFDLAVCELQADGVCGWTPNPAFDACMADHQPDPPPPPAGSCRRTGCSGTVCAAQDMPSTCVWTDYFKCYDLAVCEPQADGACGWTFTADYDACMADYQP